MNMKYTGKVNDYFTHCSKKEPENIPRGWKYTKTIQSDSHPSSLPLRDNYAVS